VYAKDISNEDHRKHEIIPLYNSTKTGVDTVGQIVRCYICRFVVTRLADRIATGILRELLRYCDCQCFGDLALQRSMLQ